MAERSDSFIPADAIDAIKTLPYVMVDRMTSRFVALDQVVGLLRGWAQISPTMPGTIAGLLALVDRERKAGIDADRLGRAVHAANDHKGPYCLFDDIEAAKDIAAEYARLRSGSPAPEGGEYERAAKSAQAEYDNWPEWKKHPPTVARRSAADDVEGPHPESADWHRGYEAGRAEAKGGE